MKYILTLLFLVSFVAYGQEPPYTPMRLNYQFRGIKVDSLFLIPSFNDTTAANSSTMKNVAGAMIRTGNDFWMRNATINAWLQNVNVGTGASPSIQFVDSVWRIAGKDSIFWRKSGVTNKIKDSTVTDSPDRIDGTATGKVTSTFASQDFDIQSVNLFTLAATTAQHTHTDYSLVSGQIYLEGAGTKGLSIYIDTNLMRVNRGTKQMLQIDTLGNFTAGDATRDSLLINLSKTNERLNIKSKNPSIWREAVSGISSQIKTGYGDNGIDLTSSNYDILVPGVYIISVATTNQIVFPDAASFIGQTIVIVNTDGSDATISGSNTFYDRGTGNTITKVTTLMMATFYSDGLNWYGFEL